MATATLNQAAATLNQALASHAFNQAEMANWVRNRVLDLGTPGFADLTDIPSESRVALREFIQLQAEELRDAAQVDAPTIRGLVHPDSPTRNDFHTDFFAAQANKGKGTKSGKKGKKSKKVVEALHKILRPFLLRRVKSDVEKNLLPSECLPFYTPTV